MTQFLLALNAMLIFVNTALPQLRFIDDTQKSIAAFAVGCVLAFVGPFLPKVSETLRRVMSLQRRG